MTLTTATVPASMDDISIGDIWVSSWGYDQTNVDFYKVVGKTAKMIQLRHIGQRITSEAGFMSEHVMPDPERELMRREYMSREAAIRKGAVIVRECDGDTVYAEVPAISRHKVKFWPSGCGVDLTSYSGAYPWDGRELYQSHYA